MATVNYMTSNFGGKLRKIRMRQGIGLRELSRRARLTPRAVQKVELNLSQPTMANLLKLTACLDLTKSERLSLLLEAVGGNDPDKVFVAVVAEALRREGLEVFVHPKIQEGIKLRRPDILVDMGGACMAEIEVKVS